jgi:DNA primase
VSATLSDRIPDLLARVDLAAEVERRAGPPSRVSGGTFTFHCPHPSHDDRTPSFTVTIEGANAGRWRCWSACGTGGDVIDLLVWLDGCTKAEAIDRLAADVGLARPAPERIDPHELVASPGLDAVFVRFLEQRQWVPDVTTALGIHPVALQGRPFVRFPFRQNGRTAFHQDRRIGPGIPKFLTPKGARIVCPYEADRIAHAHEVGALVIVEGVPDVVALLHAFPDAAVVGIPGVDNFKSAWSAAFARLEVVVFADNDEAGEKMRRRVTEHLDGVAAAVYQVRLPGDVHDIDDWRRRAGDDESFADQLLHTIDGPEQAVGA